MTAFICEHVGKETLHSPQVKVTSMSTEQASRPIVQICSQEVGRGGAEGWPARSLFEVIAQADDKVIGQVVGLKASPGASKNTGLSAYWLTAPTRRARRVRIHDADKDSGLQNTSSIRAAHYQRTMGRKICVRPASRTNPTEFAWSAGGALRQGVRSGRGSAGGNWLYPDTPLICGNLHEEVPAFHPDEERQRGAKWEK